MEDKFINLVRNKPLGAAADAQASRISNGVKLTDSVYKVLEFFPESDPLKNRAKDKTLAIMESLILIDETSGWASFQKEKAKTQLLEDIDILLGYLWIGKSQGWLNSSNCLIIANEYEKIKKGIEPMIELTKKLPGIDSSFGAAQDKPPTLQERTQEAPFGSPGPVFNDTRGNPMPSDADDIENPDSSNISDRQNPPSYEITARQRKIIEFLIKNERAQVMDLQKILPDITKRTIRRDLDELLEAGKIIRSGDFNQVFYKIKE